MRALLVAAVATGLAGCTEAPPRRTYYDRYIAPILVNSCAGNTSGCHRANPDDPFDHAGGNFDVTSFENVQKRRDLLRPFGSYPLPLLLIKATSSTGIEVPYRDRFEPLRIGHVGGANLVVGEDAYLTLLTWTENGATENGLPPPTPARAGTGACSTALPSGFDPAPYLNSPHFAEFETRVQPILDGCASSTCHGAPQADFYIACGSGPDSATQRAFNMSQVWAFVDAPVDQSQILRIPLARAAGGGPPHRRRHVPRSNHDRRALPGGPGLGREGRQARVRHR